MGLRKYQRAKGQKANILKKVKKGDFWKQSRYVDKYYFLKTRKYGRGYEWKEGEERILGELVKRGYKGKNLVSEFNRRVTPNRSYMSIHVKASKLGLRK